jgi:multiple sugar transport system ATP-binding protein
MSRVALQGVTKRFGDVVAVDDVTLEIRDQEFLVLLGPSGCGKSTVLRLIAGLDDPDEGIIRIADRIVNRIDPKDRDVAMVFQTYALYPQMTVRRNIEFPLKARRVAAAERARLVDDVMEMLGLTELQARKPAQLSGGQRQRVALARAIVRRPAVFLMDEPLSNLDAKLRVQTRADLIELQRRLETTVAYVTHDQVEAMTMGHRIAVMTAGALQQVGPPDEIYDRPANVFVAGFIGSPPMNMLSGTLAVDGGTVVVELPGCTIAVQPPLARALSTRGAGPVIAGVRPEHLRLHTDGMLPGVVVVVESLGYERHVVCRVQTNDGEQLVIARHETEAPVPREGEAVRLAFEPQHLHAFDPATKVRIDPGAPGPR